MEASCIRQTELPSVTRLFSDFTYHPDRVSRFYPYLPLHADSFRDAAQRVKFSAERRRALVDALRVQNAGSPLLDKLAEPETVAVVTGQQVGLFSGPAYTVYKALSAIKLAEELTRQGTPAVPVFWLATEDHDFHEVNQAWMFGADFQPQLLTAAANPKLNQPVGRVTLEVVPGEQLRQILHGLPFGEQAAAMVEAAYRPGVNFGQAFADLLTRLLGERFPILRVDPMLPEFRALAAPVLARAVQQAPELTQAIRRRNQDLAEAGYHAQVHVEDATSLVFLLEDGQRLNLRRQNGHYKAGSRTFTAADLAGRAHDLSPNALLRPVVQDSIIPTVTYVGGPSELAYLAQSEVIYRELLGRQPIAVHRSSFTVLDGHSAKLMNRYGLSLPDFFHGEQELKERAARRLADPNVIAHIRDAREAAVAQLDRMKTSMEGFDRSIAKSLEKSWRKIEYQFENIERKVRREALNRDERAAADVTALAGLMYPRRHLQERLYSIVPLIAQHGLDLIPRIYDWLSLDCPDHQVLTV